MSNNKYLRTSEPFWENQNSNNRLLYNYLNFLKHLLKCYMLHLKKLLVLMKQCSSTLNNNRLKNKVYTGAIFKMCSTIIFNHILKHMFL